MAALIEARDTQRREGDLLVVPVKAATKVFLGSIAVADAGFAAPGRTAAGLKALGRVAQTVDNTAGAAGALSVEIERGVFLFENSATDPVAQADLFADCYIEDDQTVCKTASGKSRAGKLIALDVNGVWVEVGF